MLRVNDETAGRSNGYNIYTIYVFVLYVISAGFYLVTNGTSSYELYRTVDT
jgi:hypothetical protein